MSSAVLEKLLRGRLFHARQYIMRHKSKITMAPAENCDVLMTFPESTDDHTLLWLLNQIRLGIPQIRVQIRQHKYTHNSAFFITSAFENLLRGAEQMGMQKTVKARYGGGTRRFSCEEDDIYENIESELCFFTSQERQSIIKYWLDNLRAKQGEALHNIHFLEGQPIIPELILRGAILQIFPLHEQRIINQLMTSWVQAVCEKQPLDDICDYFGVKIAMYFAWLGFYTNSMLYPAVIGFLLWIFAESDQASQDICCVVFAIFNVVWATLFLERWKRREAELAYKWGTLDTPTESLEEPRPQFWGVKRRSPVTDCEEFFYPPWKRRMFCWFVSLPICILCLCFVCLAMFVCLELQEFVMETKELPSICRFIPKLLLAITVTVCDEVYKKIALWLNDQENYRLQSTYDNNLILKTVFFQFINSYLSLFYIGFYLKDMERLKEMLATLLIFRQFLQNIKEVLQPYLYEHHKLGALRMLSDLIHTKVLNYSNLIMQRMRRTCQASLDVNKSGSSPDQSEKTERRSLIGSYKVPKTEEADDAGLKQRKVSFTEKVEYKDQVVEAPTQGRLLDDGSPTLVVEGMDPSSIFDMCDDDENVKETVSKLQGPQRRKTTCAGDNHSMDKKKSWMDPPEETGSTVLTQPEIESCMLTYEDTLQDYQEMFIQFGYVVLFSSAFPLAAMCALINNIVEIRSDALKLCSGLQRPFGQRVENIGQWQTAMEAMGLIAIIVNCYLIGQCGQLKRLFPWLSPEMAIVSVVLLEHFVILLKYVIHIAIPDIPSWVADEMAKLEYQRREALKKHEHLAQQHQQQQRRKNEEEEEHQKMAEELARQESEQDKSDPNGGEDHHNEKSIGTKFSSGGDKPKRPSSILGNNNVMKLKQKIPLQGKFTSTTSPSGEAKLPGFLKYLKSPEFKKEAAMAVVPAATHVSQEKSQSPSKSFNPGKLFNFGKENLCTGAGSDQQAKLEDASRSSYAQLTNNDQIPSSEELPSSEFEKGKTTDSGSSNPSKKQ
ncbi:anoctamin-8-like [Xyrauchen texanus]|uniref:anoctamin-8-like n=1 Tax=Xyrauchen texanus TaxID=154827 RepID=UPI002241E2F9|nr:anoctamin-8-like [Xyrauchen texanus]XP_051990181.1 anoctamin-8-like [Xyrauchen texanus]